MISKIVPVVVGFFLIVHLNYSSASLVYDNGESSWSGATNIYGRVVADDFVLSQDTFLTGVSMDLWLFPTYDVSNLAGMSWWIFENNNGDPGSVVQYGNVQNPAPSYVGVHLSGTVNFWTLFFEFGNDLPLNRDTVYWLGLGVFNQAGTVSWSNSPVTGFDEAVSDAGTLDNWEHNSNPLLDTAFRLYGNPVPVPSAVMFFATGLVWFFGLNAKFDKNQTRKY